MALEFQPVTGEDLVDREAIIGQIMYNFNDILREVGKCYILVGRRRVGKSSVLEEVNKRLEGEKKLVSVYLINIPRSLLRLG